MLIPGKVLYSNPSLSTLTLDIGPSTFKEFVVYEITPSEDVYSNFGEEIAVFEATHGSAGSFAGKNRVNPGSIILSGEMMLRYMGWNQAADYVLNGVKGAIRNKQLTYDLARARAGRRVIRTKTRDKTPRTTEEVKQEMSKLVPGAWLVTTSGFGEAVINNM